MDFDQIKNIFSAVTEKGKEYAGIAVDKTKSAGRIAKLAVEMTGEKEALKKAYVELGKAYYEECRASAAGLFAQLCEEVEAVNARIAAMQAEMDELKSSFSSSGEDADFEDVVGQDEESCAGTEPPAGETSCGSCEDPSDPPEEE